MVDGGRGGWEGSGSAQAMNAMMGVGGGGMQESGKGVRASALQCLSCTRGILFFDGASF